MRISSPVTILLEVVLGLSHVANSDRRLMDILLSQQGFRMGLNIVRIADWTSGRTASFS